MVIGVIEYFLTLKKNGFKPFFFYAVVVSLAIYVFNFFYAQELIEKIYFFAIIPLFAGVFIIELFNKTDKPFQNVALAITGIMYLSLPYSLLHYFVFKTPQSEYNPGIILGIVLLIWSYDAGAYGCGSIFGKHSFFKRLSPAKTWEGFLGGLVFTLGISYFVSLIFSELELFHWMIISVIIVVFGTLGDLSESMFKRTMGVKDTSNIIPGHGGVLDRFDAFVMSVPMVFVYLKLAC